MKIKKVLTQQLNVLSLPEIRIEAKSNDMGLERKYSILGGVLYIDEKPVHHYFSKNMFFIYIRTSRNFRNMERSRGAFSLPTTV